jgi:hypothetical protein
MDFAMTDRRILGTLAEGTENSARAHRCVRVHRLLSDLHRLRTILSNEH